MNWFSDNTKTKAVAAIFLVEVAYIFQDDNTKTKAVAAILKLRSHTNFRMLLSRGPKKILIIYFVLSFTTIKHRDLFTSLNLLHVLVVIDRLQLWPIHYMFYTLSLPDLVIQFIKHLLGTRASLQTTKKDLKNLNNHASMGIRTPSAFCLPSFTHPSITTLLINPPPLDFQTSK